MLLQLNSGLRCCGTRIHCQGGKLMKKIFLVLGFFVILGFSGCDSSSPSEQEYDILEFVVNSSDWAIIQAHMETIADLEANRENLNQLQSWISVNTTPQIFQIRNSTRAEITDLLLEVTTLSRDQINALFRNVNSFGKGLVILQLPNSNWSIIFVDRI